MAGNWGLGVELKQSEVGGMTLVCRPWYELVEGYGLKEYWLSSCGWRN